MSAKEIPFYPGDTYQMRMTGKKLKALPHVIRFLKRTKGKAWYVSSMDIIDFLWGRGLDLQVCEVAFIIRYIRLNGLVKRLVANSRGYWIEDNTEAFRRYCSRLNRRGLKICLVSKELLKQA